MLTVCWLTEQAFFQLTWFPTPNGFCQIGISETHRFWVWSNYGYFIQLQVLVCMCLLHRSVKDRALWLPLAKKNLSYIERESVSQDYNVSLCWLFSCRGVCFTTTKISVTFDMVNDLFHLSFDVKVTLPARMTSSNRPDLHKKVPANFPRAGKCPVLWLIVVGESKTAIHEYT